MALPISGCLQWIHRKHRVTGNQQRLHPRTSIRLDPDDHIGWFGVLWQVVGDQRMQLRHARDTLRQPLFHQPLPGLVDHLDVVVVLGPIISNEQHGRRSSSRPAGNTQQRALEETGSYLMVQCSSGTSSHQPYRPLTHQRGVRSRDRPQRVRLQQCSPRRRLGQSLTRLAPARPCNPIRLRIGSISSSSVKRRPVSS